MIKRRRSTSNGVTARSVAWFTVPRPTYLKSKKIISRVYKGRFIEATSEAILERQFKREWQSFADAH